MAVATPSPSVSQLLPSFGFPANSVTPSGTIPDTAHLTGGSSNAISQAAVKVSGLPLGEGSARPSAWYVSPNPLLWALLIHSPATAHKARQA
jgi:hypothetical protein